MKGNHRELDLKVAAILGQLDPPTLNHKYYDWEKLDDGTWRGTRWLDVRAYEEMTWPPHYSTSISAAWQVIEWLIKKKHYVGVSFLPGLGQWRCIIDSSTTWADKMDKTMPEAVCMALLGIAEQKEENQHGCTRTRRENAPMG